ncbi:uncharacterized protein [Watersipora subatra]|uniref:uncharacterized protein n=1 Tax=Watersipora subatra TaxID=2589382 RepID=UPI00355ADFF0
MQLFLLVHLYVVVHLAAVEVLAGSDEYDIPSLLASSLKLDKHRSLLFQPYGASIKSKRLAVFHFNISSETFKSVDKISFYYSGNFSTSIRMSQQKTSSTHWTDIHFGYNTTKAYLGRLRDHTIYEKWSKIKLPKKLIKNIITNNFAEKGDVVFDLILKRQKENWEYISWKQAILQIEPNPNKQDNVKVATLDEPVALPRCAGECCLEPLTVNLDAIGYDWILSPKQYTANYCSGRCNYKAMTNTDKSGLDMQSRITEMTLAALNVNRSVLSCTPASVKIIPMIYRDFTGMIRTSNSSLKTVTGCRCR